MAGRTYDDQLPEIYLDPRPNYPKEWFSMLADRTLHHSLAWDVGTGDGDAAISVAEFYDRVIGTDTSEHQLTYSIAHPKVTYLHTPRLLSDDDLINLVGGENSVDLITAAHAVHWFDMPSFYSIASRALRKPGGIIAVWCFHDVKVDPEFDTVMKKFQDATLPYWHPKIQYALDGYRTLPFPFEDIGLGSEGKPYNLDITKELAFEGYMNMLRSWSVVQSSKKPGNVDLLDEGMVKEFETAWGGPGLVRSVVYKAFMLAGSIKQ